MNIYADVIYELTVLSFKSHIVNNMARLNKIEGGGKNNELAINSHFIAKQWIIIFLQKVTKIASYVHENKTRSMEPNNSFKLEGATIFRCLKRDLKTRHPVTFLDSYIKM